MSENVKNKNSKSTQRLDDEARVKVLSPSAMVVKRFARNRLGVTGAIILVTMFVFSFIGVLISPYGQTQVFHKQEVTIRDYANFSENKELRYVAAKDANFSYREQSAFALAKSKGENTFTSGDSSFTWHQNVEGGAYFLTSDQEIASVRQVLGNLDFNVTAGVTLSDDFKKAFEQASAASEETFEYEGQLYTIAKSGKSSTISKQSPVAIASTNVFDAYDPADKNTINGFEFRWALETALSNGESSMVFDGNEYFLDGNEDGVVVYAGNAPQEEKAFAVVSTMLGQAISTDVSISPAFKAAVTRAISQNKNSFIMEDNTGVESEFFLTSKGNNRYAVRKEMPTTLIDMYASPSRAHWLGTDGNGMDVLTRLMYGGRVSLLVGFVVVFIEIILGVVVGGLAGYFGGWTDTLLMRLIDLVNSIPYYPVMIILGAVMDSLRIDPYVRIWILMIVLGLLGWTGIARIVRGQILTLREQDFMVATEATGIRVSRRIFKHLVPNIMPLLIVQATMSLGGIIITEATLSFLGLGLKYPLASWGTIINAATDVHIMTNYWFIWVPAGLLILITVLGFNFVGDGLRDAFDPKMKR